MTSEPDASAEAVASRATMLDVATLAGVSIKTVSRVVNGEPGVSQALMERVTAAMSDLSYRHNLAASNLRRGQRTASIGVLVQDLSNAYCSELLRAIEDRARTSGVVVMAASTDEDPQRERELVEAFVARRTDGLIVMPSTHDLTYLVAEVRAGLAVVAVDRPSPDPDMDCVVVDNVGASADAVRHLIEHGHRSIAMLGDNEGITTAKDRLLGYRQALRTAGLPERADLEAMGLRASDDARDALCRLLDLPEPPTAVFAGRNTICQGAALALQRRGMSHRVALIGFDEVAIAEFVEPRISVVRQDTYAIGTRAIERLMARLEGDRGPARTDVVPTVLVARGSGEIPPG